MERACWYLVAYDIACPKRLQRVHRLLKGAGLAAQYSVFFVCATERALEALMDEMDAIIRSREDDIRAWAVSEPAEVWLHGRREFQSLVIPARGEAASARRGWSERLRLPGRGRR